MTVYGASRKIGRSLREIEEAWHFRYEDLGKDTGNDTYGFNILLPRLGDAAPRLFEQQSLFAEFNPEDTVLDWFGDVTSAVLGNDQNSRLLDSDILGQFSNFRNLNRNGIQTASVQTRRYQGPKTLIVDNRLGESAQSLVQTNPAAKRTRIVGVLDKVAFLDRVLSIQLNDGARIKVLWAPENVEPIRALWGSKVMLGGTLQFRPNGTPQVFIAEAIDLAGSGSSFWETLPAAETVVKRRNSESRLLLGQSNPLKKLRGVFDGEVSDEEFDRMVEEFCYQ